MEETAGTQERTWASPMRMGIVLFLVSEAFLFGSLFWTYYYLRAETSGWPPGHPSMTLASINTVLLLVNSVAVWWGGRAIRQGKERVLLLGLLVTFVLGSTFLGITAWEWTHETFRPWTHAYGSIFYTLTGFHALHVFGGVMLMLALLARTLRHQFSAERFVGVEVGSLYWHFVDLVWIFVFITIFVVR